MRRTYLAKGIATAAIAFGVIAGVTATAKAAPAAPSISLKEQKATGQSVDSWTIQYADLQPGQELYFNVYSTDPKKSETGEWVKNLETGKEYFDAYWDYTDEGTSSLEDTETEISRNDLAPGKKTVVAYLFDENAYDAAIDAYYNDTTGQLKYPEKADYVSPASAPISINATMVADVSTTIKSTSVTLNMRATNATGYQIYRKVGKKYKKIATVAKNTFKDEGLLSKTEYAYKVRPYYKDPDTGKISYGKYTTLKRTTKGSALNLKITIKKTKNVKLSWKKVKGATAYEIYRYAGASDATKISKGVNDSFGSYKLIKTVKKSKKTYTDTKTSANESYSYIVRAVMSKDKKVKGDSNTVIQESGYVDFSFGMPDVERAYTNANGDYTIEWQKGYGIDGYIVKKYVEAVYDAAGNKVPNTGKYVEIGRLGKTATKYTFKAEMTQKADGTYNTETRYTICAYKGITISDESYYTATKTLGMVPSVTAKKVANGVQVSWTPVNGASYYRVYRVKAGSLVKNSDIGGYANSYGTAVTEYVGAQAPVAVDVAAVNASIDAYRNGQSATEPIVWNKLDPTKTYYYQNYQYRQSTFTGTSMIDYSGDIYSVGTTSVWDDNYDKVIGYKAGGVAEKDEAITVGPKDGVSYQYYVVAYAAQQETVADYGNDAEDFARASQIVAVTPGTMNASVVGTRPLFKDSYLNTVGCKKVGSVNYVTAKATKKPVIKSVKVSKKTATIKIKKKVKGASEYKIYRSTKKKGKYMCVGTTTKPTFKDSGLEGGKTYYYKVKAVKKNASGADKDSAYSKVKSVKVKK